MLVDTHGESIVPGMLYAVGVGSSTKKVISETRYDLDADVILIRRRGSNDQWQRLDEISEDLKFVPVNADGIEIGIDGEPKDSDSESECEADPRESVRSSILRARALKDQLAGIEAELVVELGADDDVELRDAIMQAIHGDGTAESVLELIEA